MSDEFADILNDSTLSLISITYLADSSTIPRNPNFGAVLVSTVVDVGTLIFFTSNFNLCMSIDFWVSRSASTVVHVGRPL